MQPSPAQPESSAGPTPAAPPTSTAAPTAIAPGDAVTTLLAGLDELDRRPLTEHVEVYEQVHGRLQAALREIDSA